MRVFRRGKDDVYRSGMHDHEAYHGDRSKDALVQFANSLVDSADNPKARLNSVKTFSGSATGCNLAGERGSRGDAAVHAPRCGKLVRLSCGGQRFLGC